MDKEKKYKKLQFDFALKDVIRLDELVEMVEASSRAEVIRNALRVYEHLQKKAKEGYEIRLEKNDDKTTIVFIS